MVAVADKPEVKTDAGTGTFAPWYHPTYRAITLRPDHNHTIVLDNYQVFPKTQEDDDYVREWVRQERRGNDPERWHGDNIPDSQPSLECGFCKALFRNYNVHADHLQALHLREELADFRTR